MRPRHATVETATAAVDGGVLERALEVGVVVPRDAPARGVIVWCHGLGGRWQHGAGLAATWAARGYCVVLPTFADAIRHVVARHPELGRDPADPQLDQWALDPEIGAFMVRNMLEWPWREDRLAVVRTVLDATPGLLADVPGAGAIGQRIGIGGHSFGAYVSQLLAGAVIDGPSGEMSFRDERVVAAVVASGQGRSQAGLRDGSWNGLVVPMLNITGTRDGGATTADPRWKREPFELSPPGQKYQVVIDGADHGLGGVSGESARFPANAAHLGIVEAVTSAFWDAHLGGDEGALSWLSTDGPTTTFGGAAEYARR